MLPPREEPLPPIEPLEEYRDPEPEPAARPKEKVTIDVDAGIDKNVIAGINKDRDLVLNLKCLLNCKKNQKS